MHSVILSKLLWIGSFSLSCLRVISHIKHGAGLFRGGKASHRAFLAYVNTADRSADMIISTNQENFKLSFPYHNPALEVTGFWTTLQLNDTLTCSILFLWRTSPTRTRAASFLKFLDHTQWLTTVGTTPMDEESALRRGLSVTTHNTHKRQTSMSTVETKPAISASHRPKTIALDSLVTGNGTCLIQVAKWCNYLWKIKKKYIIKTFSYNVKLCEDPMLELF